LIRKIGIVLQINVLLAAIGWKGDMANKIDWIAARVKWENDPRLTHEALALEIGVSKQAVSGQIKRKGWAKKSIVKTAKSVVKDNSDNSFKTTKKDNKAKSTSMSIPVKKERTEKIHEGEFLHGNSLYKYEYDEQAYKLCLLGATDVELADFFNVDERTVNNWKHDHPCFFQSLQRGKVMADANISERLYQRALGYTHSEEKIFCNMGEVIRANTTKHYPPDTGAIKLWLFNRRSKDWKANVEPPPEDNKSVFPATEVLDALYAKALAQAAERDKFLIGRRERLGIVIDPE
jgi:hypothetical protein